jgi:hypothetical protein
METYLETADVARLARVAPALVRRDAAAGNIEVAAITQRGCRLFRFDAIRRYLAAREARRAESATSPRKGAR